MTRNYLLLNNSWNIHENLCLYYYCNSPGIIISEPIGSKDSYKDSPWISARQGKKAIPCLTL